MRFRVFVALLVGLWIGAGAPLCAIACQVPASSASVEAASAAPPCHGPTETPTSEEPSRSGCAEDCPRCADATSTLTLHAQKLSDAQQLPLAFVDSAHALHAEPAFAQGELRHQRPRAPARPLFLLQASFLI